MRCLLRRVALGLWAAAIAAPLLAETTPGPPDWADSAPSVYLAKGPAVAAEKHAEVAEEPATENASVTLPAGAASEPLRESHSAPAALETPVASTPSPTDRDRRHLAPPKRSALAAAGSELDGPATLRPNASRPRIDFGIPAGSVYTIFSALAIVIGAFLLLVWALRRGVHRTSAALPTDVVSVLGRVPLAARQFAELLRVGNKLVLVSLTPSGAEPLTEVTDPVEVDRLVGLCQQYSPHSTTKAFEQVFRQLSRESAPAGFLGGESLPSLSSATAAYRAHRGDTTRG